jgi:hypothetical protein
MSAFAEPAYPHPKISLFGRQLRMLGAYLLTDERYSGVVYRISGDDVQNSSVLVRGRPKRSQSGGGIEEQVLHL